MDDVENVDCLSGSLTAMTVGDIAGDEHCVHQITDKIFLSGIAPLKTPAALKALDIELIVCCTSTDTSINKIMSALLAEVPGMKLIILPYEDMETQSLSVSVERLPYFANFNVYEMLDELPSGNLLDLSNQILTRFPSRVLVHCYAGVSRSVAVVCYHLMRRRVIPFQQALSLVQSVRSIADPNDGFRAQLEDMDEIIQMLA